MANLAALKSASRSGGPRQGGRDGGPPQVDISVEVVTPEKAKDWLTRNVHNRNLSKSTVARFARDMTAGNWESHCYDPIRFNGNGDLVDGQHRLAAILRSAQPLETIIIRGLPKSVQEKLDQGKVRSTVDHLSLRGYASAPALSAAARALLAIKRGYQVGGGDKTTGRPTNTEVIKLVERHGNLVESVQAAGPVLGMHPSTAAALHYVGAHLLNERDTADAFLAVFISGEPAYKGDPAHLWRERVIASEQRKSLRMTPTTRRIGSIHAWNMFRVKRELEQFRVPDSASVDGLDVENI